MTMDRYMREQARLVILKAIAAEIDERLNSELLRRELERFAIARPIEWVHTELAWLAEMGAVTLVDAGTVKVASLTEYGHRHLRREVAIEGIQRPRRPVET